MGPGDAPGIVGVVPAFNEADRIESVIVGSLRHLTTVIVVDDGSRDQTAALAEAAGATVVRMPRNGGKGAALAEGFREALRMGAEGAITLDADGQHDPEEVPTFVAAYRARACDLVIGVRDYGAMPATRRLANTLGRWILRWAVGRDLPDNQSGYRLLGGRGLALLQPVRSDFAAEVEMIARAYELGLVVEWVPISTLYAGEASHFHPVADTAAFLALAMELRRRRVRSIDVADGAHEGLN